MYQTIAVLGSTGSVGVQALDVCAALGIRVLALSANSNIALLEKQARAHSPRCVAISDKNAYRQLKERLADTAIKVLCGADGLCDLASLPDADIVLNSVVGIAGLLPTLAALGAGKPVALANKETLVAGGELVMALAKEKNLPILPVDSEHSAIFQCLRAGNPDEVKRLLLTASGGPFFGWSRERMESVTVQQAISHPVWSMGKKISVDSASLMNKGLELIEAMHLFNVPPEQIDILVHRQGIIHSLVEYIDGSVIAQLGSPDMRTPIQYALTHPQRTAGVSHALDWAKCTSLTFEPPDYESFDCLKAALQAAKQGGLHPAVLNGANEQAVALFLAEKIGFCDIGRAVLKALNSFGPGAYTCVEDVLKADAWARQFVLSYCTL